MDDAILGQITRCEKKKLEGRIKKRTEENKGDKKKKGELEGKINWGFQG